MLVLCHSTSEGQAKACEWFCARSNCGALKEINEYGYTRCIPKEEEGQNHTTNRSRNSDPHYALFVDLFFDCGSEKHSLETLLAQNPSWVEGIDYIRRTDTSGALRAYVRSTYRKLIEKCAAYTTMIINQYASIARAKEIPGETKRARSRWCSQMMASLAYHELTAENDDF